MSVMRRLGLRKSERGQAIIMLVMIFTVSVLILAIVIDFGLWLSERRGAQRAADFAALAGAQDLPEDGDQARANALEWAKQNGYEHNVDGVVVTVELLCTNDFTNPPPSVCSNPSPGSSSPCNLVSGCDSLRVTIRKPADHLFSSIFQIGDVHVGFGSAAGLSLDLVAMDTTLLLDATGSMGVCDEETQADDGCEVLPPPTPSSTPTMKCDQNAPGCPIKEARDAANNFLDVLLGGANLQSQVAYAPYNHCYNPPQDWDLARCLPAENIIRLTNDVESLRTGIENTEANGNTNLCLALWQGRDLMNGPDAQAGENVRRSLVFLTDGDNNYIDFAFDGVGHPPDECLPFQPEISQPNTGSSACDPSYPRERDLDKKTNVQAELLKSSGIEIYVVGLGVCGEEDGQIPGPGYCSGIGDLAHDVFADQRLLKCVASSIDQYFRVESAQDLPEVFEVIAFEIAGRALIE